MTNMVLFLLLRCFGIRYKFSLFYKINLVNCIRAGNEIRGFSNEESVVNVVSYGSNILRCALR